MGNKKPSSANWNKAEGFSSQKKLIKIFLNKGNIFIQKIGCD